MKRYSIGFAVFVTGFVVMGIELICGRLLAPFFGASIYVWGSIIFTFMVSLSVGYLLGGKLSLHAPSQTKLGILIVVSGLSLLPITSSSYILNYLTFEDPRISALSSSFALFFIPTCLMGTVSPYAVCLKAKSPKSMGLTAGKLYFLSTFGSAIGTLGTAFYFILWFPLDSLVLMFSACSIGCGFIVIITDRLSRNGSSAVKTFT